MQQNQVYLTVVPAMDIGKYLIVLDFGENQIPITLIPKVSYCEKITSILCFYRKLCLFKVTQFCMLMNWLQNFPPISVTLGKVP